MSRNLRIRIQAVLHTVLYAALFLVLSAITIICMETIWRGSFSETIMWFSRRAGVFSLLVLTTASAAAVLYLLTGRMMPSVAVVNLICMAAALIQHYKMELRGEPFVLSDILLTSEALSVLGKFTIEVPWYVVLSCVLMLIIPLITYGIRIHGHWYMRIALMCICLLMCVGGCKGILDLTAGAQTRHEDYYALNGLGSGLIKFRPRRMKEPENYSKENVEIILGDYAQEDQLKIKPDILFIMSESLYDLSKVENAVKTEQMMPYTRMLQEKHWGAQAYVISYGGGTSLSEYEVLTGYKAQKGEVAPYLSESSVYEGMDTLVTMLESYGYHTMAMHPNTGRMYNRNNAYLRLGFDERVFSENMNPVTGWVGSFPSDAYLFEEIIGRYESRPKDKPWFSFVVTYQNHGEYTYEYDRQDIVIRDGNGGLKKEASTYANAIKESDEALEDLVAYFEAGERPVVIVVFGDHAPALSGMGYETGEGIPEHMRTHSTPVLVYSNYGLQMPEDIPDTIPAYRLGATVLHTLGFRGDRYFNYLADYSEASLIDLDGIVLDSEGVKEDTVYCDEIRKKIELLYYDRVYGKRYGKAGDRQ